MNLVMITHAREPAYLDATLESLFASDDSIDKVHLLIHETNIECAARWITHPNVTWTQLTPEEHDAKMALGKRTRVAHAMALALERAPEGPCIFLEDDAVFAPDWLQLFQNELGALGETHDEKMIVLRTHLRHQKNGIVRWDPKSYYGTVAVYFGAHAKKTAIASLHAWTKRTMAAPGMGSDVCLQRMLLLNRSVTLYARFPNLVEHTGRVSSIGSLTAQKQHAAPAIPAAHALETPAAPETKRERAPVTFFEKPLQAPVAAPTPMTGAVTTKQRKNPNPPVTFTKKI